MSPVNIVNRHTICERQQEISLSLASGPSPFGPRPGPLTPLLDLPIRALAVENAWVYGDPSDLVLEAAVVTTDKGVIEIGYYDGHEKPKSIAKVSTQIGCPCGCKFCEVGGEPFHRSLTAEEIYEQAALILQIAAAYGVPLGKPHKVNFAGTGEPLLNSELPGSLALLGRHDLSMKVSTVMPSGRRVRESLMAIGRFAASYPQSVQIQVSLISTDEKHRQEAAGIKLVSFAELAEMARAWRAFSPVRPQINLSLIMSEGTPVDVRTVEHVLPPDLFRFRFRDYVPTAHGTMSMLKPMEAGLIRRIKDEFRKAGYTVTDDATPTATEAEFGLASNVTRRRMMESLDIPALLENQPPR